MSTTSHVEPTVVVPIQDELEEPIQDRLRGNTERLAADFSRISTRIHRFPRGLRGIGGPDGRYITPSVVALGPYHHGSPDLQEMEELKHAAALHFCWSSGHQVEEVYGKILSVAEQARGCYDEDSVAKFSHSQFAEMMFLDGCFLLEYLDSGRLPPLLKNGMSLSMGPCMLRDTMLLENQLPWLVLEALMTFKDVDVHGYVLRDIHFFVDLTHDRSVEAVMRNGNYRAPHLLGLARLYLIGSMPPEEMLPPLSNWEPNLGALSAVQLTEMGVKLKPSKAAWFADMSARKKCLLFGELSISPMFMNDFTACWLVNMAAFEARTAVEYPNDGFLVSSYLSLLALLIDKEQDVHELRARHVVTSLFSNQEILEYFKAIAKHLRLGHRYFAILSSVENYRKERRVSIAIYRFLYHNGKTIVTLISIASVLVGIFKALYSLKQN